MISKRAFIQPENDNYARLANYIAAADHEGEKTVVPLVRGLSCGDDYAEGMAEGMDMDGRGISYNRVCRRNTSIREIPGRTVAASR
ncbi:hypothetical protein FACS1894206_06990 [Deltaproteobacteria bacterium]|nr:hypothetical protein FACS1894206_06990 [Deltaproteobacteria bacterium]